MRYVIGVLLPVLFQSLALMLLSCSITIFGHADVSILDG
jgi:hypothetical protein